MSLILKRAEMGFTFKYDQGVEKKDDGIYSFSSNPGYRSVLIILYGDYILENTVRCTTLWFLPVGESLKGQCRTV